MEIRSGRHPDVLFREIYEHVKPCLPTSKVTYDSVDSLSDDLSYYYEISNEQMVRVYFEGRKIFASFNNN